MENGREGPFIWRRRWSTRCRNVEEFSVGKAMFHRVDKQLNRFGRGRPEVPPDGADGLNWSGAPYCVALDGSRIELNRSMSKNRVRMVRT